MKIYLAGSVPKSDKDKETFDNWRTRYQQALEKWVEAEFIDPADASKDEGDSLAVAGQDCGNIKSCDLVVVNAENKIGAGTAIELAVAKYFKKPVVTVLPKDTHHRRSNITLHHRVIEDWINPFIHTFSDFIVEKIEQVEEIKDKLKTQQIKNISIIDQAIKYSNEKRT